MQAGKKRRSAAGPSALMAGGAVLGFVIIHRYFEHVVAADADTVDFWLRGRIRLFCRGMLRGLFGAHAGILTRRYGGGAKWTRGRSRNGKSGSLTTVRQKQATGFGMTAPPLLIGGGAIRGHRIRARSSGAMRCRLIGRAQRVCPNIRPGRLRPMRQSA